MQGASRSSAFGHVHIAFLHYSHAAHSLASVFRRAIVLLSCERCQSEMATKSKARTIIVRMISTAKTGFFYTTQRLRLGPRVAAVKYDPKVKARVLFVESKKSAK